MEMSGTPKEELKRLSFSDYGTSDQEEFRSSPKSPCGPQDKRVRREIANSNERRRMQSINSGFQLLRSLIPRSDGEKLSKAGILQQTADFIQTLQAEKSKLLSQTQQLKRYVSSLERSESSDSSSTSRSPPPKRRKRDTESSDEGISMQCEDLQAIEELRREMADIRRQLEEERCLRVIAEEERLKANQSSNLEVSKVGIQRASIQTQAPPPVQPPKKRYIESMPKTPSQPAPRLHEEPTSMSRRNLETIVEAIRHLEGDSMFEGKRKASVEDSSSGGVSPCYHRDLSPVGVSMPVMCGVPSSCGIPTSGMVQLFRPAYVSEHYRHVVVQPSMSS